MNNTTNNNSTNDSNLDVLFSYFHLLFFAYGSFSNVMVITVCLNGKLKHVPTFIIMSFLGLSSLCQLTAISLTTFVYNLSAQDETIAWCRVKAFFNSFSFQQMSWLIAFFNTEIYLSVRDPQFRKKYPVIKIISWIFTILSIFLFTANSSAWFIEPKEIQPNVTIFACMVLRDNTNAYFLTYLTIVSVI